MEKEINIAELLKDCPPGMELDCTMFENVTFVRVDNSKRQFPIEIVVGGRHSKYLTKEGCYHDNTLISEAKCVIFPKGKTTWEGFHRSFEDGDVVVAEDAESFQLFLLKHLTLIEDDNSYDGYCYFGWDFQCNELFEKGNWGFNRLATKEEKAKLFDTIKEHRYKWNEETKTLNKLVESHTPEKFYIRIGDIPSEEKSSVYRGETVVGYEDGVSVYDCVEIDGLYRIVMPFPLKEGQGITYEFLIQDITQCRYKIENPRNVYLVSGIEVGKGNDNEPLIKEVKILKDLTGQFNTKTDNTEETKTMEKLPKYNIK